LKVQGKMFKGYIKIKLGSLGNGVIQNEKGQDGVLWEGTQAGRWSGLIGRLLGRKKNVRKE